MSLNLQQNLYLSFWFYMQALYIFFTSLLLTSPLHRHHFGSIYCALVSWCIWPQPLLIVPLAGHAPRRHLHANHRQMYTHPFVCRDYTLNLRPWNEQKCFCS